ncbi:MAG: aspartate/glutamate racemase family protein [Pseudomonadota bacterium]
MTAIGGKSIYGASVGILMLDAKFPRIPGDMGNATTWPFPVHYRIVRSATPDRVVRRNAEGLLENFIEAAQDLVEDGVDGITTNCGFLSLFQDEIAAAVSVPVITSSLLQVDLVNRTLPQGKRAGVLTISASTLSKEHLEKARVPKGTPIETTEHGKEFTRVIIGNETRMDVDAARKDNLEAAISLKEANPDLGAIVLECTNMTPYAADISAATNLPVYSIYNFVCWFQASLNPPRFQDF